MGFITAIRFLTIIPLPGRITHDKYDLGKSLPYFPLVGLICGGILLLLHYFFSIFLPLSISYILLIICLVILTGAHHIDGFMDTFDGIVAAKTRERRLEIMQDSKVGAFGISAVVLLFLLKYVALVANPTTIPTLLLMPMLSRWMMVSSIFTCTSAKNTGMGFAFKQGANWCRFIIATIITVAISASIFNWRGIILMAGLWSISSLIILFFRSRFGGLTGDNYGAINEISEILVVLLIIIIVRFLGES